ncbi:LuxR C-terminal-related transcriptional regulator [Amycolatopsis sp. Poz14]|uniref:helix-turn-helix transcriptional regulator n=1 Tax=Amycolatopsis sp. Poz14 TaxID=1447705 RepID=UPI001EE95B5C|nr:LuxR C-terminal-related transcriptional regulator [Amycolatopsis sp. Poz14]
MTADVQWWARLARDVRAAGRGELPVETPLRAVRDKLGFACVALVSGSKQHTTTVNLGYPADMLGYLTTTYRWKCPIHLRATRLGLPLRFVDIPEVHETRTYREGIQPYGFREGVTLPLSPGSGPERSFVALSSLHDRPLDDGSVLALTMLSHDFAALADPGAEPGDPAADVVLLVSPAKVDVRSAAMERLPLSEHEARLAARCTTGERTGFRHRDADGVWWQVLVRARRPDGVLLRISRLPDPGPLTGRELDVVGLVARGWSNERISVALGIAVRTVRSHVESSLVKLDCPNRTALARHALEHDLDTLGALEAAHR